MSDKFTVRQFNYRFPTKDACLEEIKLLRFGETLDCPKCHKNNKFHKLAGRKAYSCNYCRYQLYPLAGTIFEKSTTPLKDWMYAIYLMTQTRAGISAKQLERMLGVTYKTAWRMFHQIRKLMADDEALLTGEIEIDETYLKADPQKRSSVSHHRGDSEIIFGMVERGGKAKLRHVRSSRTRVLLPQVHQNIEPGAVVYSDEYSSYRLLPKRGYTHRTINHSERKYVVGQVHTQNIENVWSNLNEG